MEAGFPTFEPSEEVKRAEAAASPPQPDQAETPEQTPEPQPGPETPPPAGQSPLDAHARGDDAFAEHPELFVGAAFAGGFVVAQILRRFGR